MIKITKRFNDINDIVFWVVVVGAINWGLSALGLNLVNMIFGSMPTLEKVIYLLIGVCGIVLAINNKNRNFMR